MAKEAGALISLDPNLQTTAVEVSLDEAKEDDGIIGFSRYCDILKISDNEIQFVSGKEDYDRRNPVSAGEVSYPAYFPYNG